MLATARAGLSPEKVLLTDPQIQLLLKAMEQVDRAALGFTPVTTNSQIRLESSNRSYDAMLHVDGATSRTIGFRKTVSGYRWIFEQEIYQGPKWWQSVDGAMRESMIIEYQIEPVDGVPTNQTFIHYTGDDTNLLGHELTLPEVKPILEKWSKAAVEPQPPDDPGVIPDVGPLAIEMIFIACVALIIGLAAIVGGAILILFLAVGIISASVLTGILRRSVSSGFRALFIQLGALAGMIGGAIAVGGITWIAKMNWHSPIHWIAGVGLGLLLGILIGWLFNKVWSQIAKVLTHKLEKQRN